MRSFYLSSIWLLFLSFCFLGCEKDDVCDGTTVATPSLVVSFYDVANPTVLKNVTNLKVTATGTTNELYFNEVNKIKIPLQTAADASNFVWTMNNSDANLLKSDAVQFNYIRSNQFISRACGYKSVFNLQNVILNQTPSTTQGNWIQNVTLVQPNITNENETHLNIYF